MDSKYIYCTKCGHKNLREQKFCTHCGASLVHVQSEHSNKNFQHQSISKSASLKRFWSFGGHSSSNRYNRIKYLWVSTIPKASEKRD